MEKEAISEASRKGYFLEPAKDDIIQEFGNFTLWENKPTIRVFTKFSFDLIAGIILIWLFLSAIAKFLSNK